MKMPEYAKATSPCCGVLLWKPPNSKGPWFCKACGKTYTDQQLKKESA